MSAILQELQRWISMMQQICEAKYYISRAEDLGHPNQFRSLNGIFEFLVYFRGALNSYAKCFVSSGNGKMRLEGTEVFLGKSDLLHWHLRILDLRHKYVAHSDDNEFEKSSLECTEADSELIVAMQSHFSFPFDRLYELRDLILYLDTYMVDRHEKHIASIERRIGKSIRIKGGEQAIAADHTDEKWDKL